MSTALALTPALSRDPRVKPGEERGRAPFSRLRETSLPPGIDPGVARRAG